ncbi:acyltransferase [Amylibacter sp.]|nr:acyltransferase [Amylibacter sp.]
MTAPEIQVANHSTKQKLGTLEIGRGWAALAVVAHHAGLSSDAFTSSNHGNMFSFGIYGVDFFFVLSGFIIYHIHQNDPSEFGAARRFLSKRIRRIYTPYLPITLALIATYFLFPSLSQEGRSWGWFTSVTLMPSNSPPALSVAWTLTFEIVFYLFFLFFYVTRYFWIIVLVWIVLVLGVAVFDLHDTTSNPLVRTLLHPLILEFVAGMVAAHLFGKISPTRWWAPLYIGIMGIVVFALLHDPHRVVLGIALAPFVLGLALFEHRYSFKISSSWALLGASSYAVYLIHNPLQSIIARLFQAYDNWPLTFAACVLITLAVGVFYHLIYERPMLRTLSQKQGASAPSSI